MKTRIGILSLFLIMVFLVAACSPEPAPAENMSDQSGSADEEMMESEGNEMMEDEDDMAESEQEGMKEGEDGEMKDSEGDEMMNEEGENMEDDADMGESSDEMAPEGEDMAESEGEDMMEDKEEEMMDEDMTATTFVIRIENVSSENGLTILAPGAFEVNDHPISFFTSGEADRGDGLEALAEDGDPSVLVESINSMMAGDMMGFAIGVFNTPDGADEPGPAGPGSAYEFVVDAYPGQYLTFATMFVQSNDWFFAPVEGGIALFDEEGSPIDGDITDQILLWDAGTEVDQSPGEGPDQAPRQSGPNTGEDENGDVVVVEEFMDYQILVTIAPQS